MANLKVAKIIQQIKALQPSLEEEEEQAQREALQSIIDAAQDKLRELNKTKTESRIKRLSRKIEKDGVDGDSVKFVSFGIGASGTKDFLSCSSDLELFRKYAEKNNYFLGNYCHEREVENAKKHVLESVSAHYESALALNKNFVVYYTGHGSKNKDRRTGDWCVSDGTISFEDVLNALRVVRERAEKSSKSVVYLVCDCCYSGQWIDKWNELKTREKSRFRVIASCDKDKTCRDTVFSEAFFKKPKSLSKSEINAMPSKAKLAEEISQRMTKTRDTHDADHDTYTKSELIKTKFSRDQLKDILHAWVKKEYEATLNRFLKVKPMYCNHDITEEDVRKNKWFSDCAVEDELYEV